MAALAIRTSRARLERPEGELGRRRQPAGEKTGGRIEPLPHESNAVTDAEHGQAECHDRSAPDDEATGEQRDARQNGKTGRARVIDGRGPRGETEQRREDQRPDARR